jgi:hypothetical protein
MATDGFTYEPSTSTAKAEVSGWLIQRSFSGTTQQRDDAYL